MAYGDFKDLHRRTFADKFLCDKAFDIAKDPKYDGYHRELASMVYKFFNKKTSGSSIKKNISNKELAEELHKSIIRIFNKKSTPTVYRYICSADPADMLLISKFNKGIRFSWVISLKDKKELQLLILFKKSQMNQTAKQLKYGQINVVNFKIDGKKNDIEMYSTHNEGKSVVAERFI